MFESVKELVDYRCMIRNLVKREIRGRYKGSILGFLWNFLTPLVQILVYIIVFTAIFKPGIDNYAIYLTAGMIAWIWFSESMQDGSGTLVANGDMLKKIYFPRMVLPISVVLSKLVNFVIMLAIYFIIIAVTGFGASWVALLMLPVAVLIMLVFLIGFTMALSAINVFFRDVQYIVTVLMMAWIWMTPVMYVGSTVDNGLLSVILKFNPMTYLIGMFQDILYWQAVPNTLNLVVSVILAIAMLLVGIILFRRLERNFAEVL